MRGDPDLRRDPTRWLGWLKPRTRLRRMLGRVRRHSPHLLLAALAAGLSYVLAAVAFGEEHAIFAPIAAVVSIGMSAGQRLLRAVEISIGVILGLVLAVLLTQLIGSGGWQLALAVLLARSAAVALKASGLMANQAAVAAVFVMVLVPLQDTPPLVRLGDAVIGGAVAVLLSALLAPDPHRVALTTAEELLNDLATAYRQLAKALEKGSADRAERTLDSLERLEGAGGDLESAMEATRERISLARSDTRVAQRRRLRAIAQLSARAGIMVTSARSCSRGVATLVRHGRRPDPTLITGLEQLAHALHELSGWVGGQARRQVVTEATLRAAVSGSRVLNQPLVSPAGQALAWQVRAAAVDVLRVLGMSHDSAVAALEEAAGRADRPRDYDGSEILTGQLPKRLPGRLRRGSDQTRTSGAGESRARDEGGARAVDPGSAAQDVDAVARQDAEDRPPQHD